MTESKFGPHVTPWKFLHVSRLAYNALIETSLITNESWSDTIGKALELEGMVTTAHNNGGDFATFLPSEDDPIRKDYETEGIVAISLTVNLVPKSHVGLLISAPPKDTAFDRYSLVLNRALQRWRDVIVAQNAGGGAAIRKSADEDFVHVVYS